MQLNSWLFFSVEVVNKSLINSGFRELFLGLDSWIQ